MVMVSSVSMPENAIEPIVTTLDGISIVLTFILRKRLPLPKLQLVILVIPYPITTLVIYLP